MQPLYRLVAERYQAFAIALADDAHHTLIEIDLVVFQAHQFRDSKSGGVKHFEHGAVAIAQWIGHQRCFEQRIDFGFGQ